MKKKFLLLIIGFLSTIVIYAKKVDGIIIFNNDSVAYVTFKITTYPIFGVWLEGIQKRLKYYNSENKKIILKPDQAKEIRFQYKGENIRMLSFSDQVFLKLIIDGRLRLYCYYHRYGKKPDWTFRYYLQKGSDELFNANRGKEFEKEMRDYLSDCPELAKKFDGKTYNYGGLFDPNPISFDIIDIVKEYNHCK